jgi:hypothetical protein
VFDPTHRVNGGAPENLKPAYASLCRTFVQLLFIRKLMLTAIQGFARQQQIENKD